MQNIRDSLSVLTNSSFSETTCPWPRVTATVVTPVSTLSFGSSAIADPKEDALQVLARWVQAFNASDIDGIVSLYANDALFIGTGSTEVGTNPEYFRNYFQSLKRDMPRGAKLESYSALELSSTVVLISGMDSVSGTKDGVIFHRPGRTSFVFAKRGDVWQIVQFHRSAMPQ